MKIVKSMNHVVRLVSDSSGQFTHRFILLAAVTVVSGVALSGTALGGLSAATGNSYNWAAYNLSTVIPAGGDASYDLTPPTNCTGFTFDMYCDEHKGKNDGVWRIGNNTHGTLKNYATGSNITGVTVSMQNVGYLAGWNHAESDWWFVNPQSTADNWSSDLYVWNYGLLQAPAISGASSDPIFSDTIGTNFGDGYVSTSCQAGYIFSGLDPSKKYDFAAIAERGPGSSPSYDWNSASLVTIFAASCTQAGTLTTNTYGNGVTVTQGFHTLGTDTTSRSYTTLTWHNDDRVMWTDITPLADGTIRFDVQQEFAGGLIGRDAPGFTAIALGEQSPGGSAPSITNAGSANITSSSAFMNGNLMSTGGVPTFVWLYWGTNDGQNTNNNWQYTNSFGQRRTGLLATNITGLSGSTTYYYRYYATNAAGATWAMPSINLTTLPTPVIVNNGATNITTNSAFMNGNLNSTGGVPTFVWLYWGTTDGQSTNNNWQHTNSFGQRATGTLTTNIAGLNSDTIYYYRYYCTNSVGTNWAGPSSNLTTLAAPRVTNSAPTDITMSSASMNGYVASTGALPTFVWLFWGGSDGQNTNSNWQHTNSFSQRGAGSLTTNILGLNVSTTYYYRYYASNSAGICWAAPSSNLVTLAAPTPPVITNTAPTNVMSASACMNGNLVSTGGAPTFVQLLWGESDGQAGAWDHTNSFGRAGIGVLTMNITELAAGTEYWYRYYATNSAGTAWASPSGNLTTGLGGGGGGKGVNLSAVTSDTYNWMAYNLSICSDYGTSFDEAGIEVDQYSNVVSGGIRDGFGGQTAPAHVTDYTTDMYGYRGTDVTTVVGENVNNPLKWKGYNSDGWKLGTKTHGTLKDYVTGTNLPGVTVTICNNTNNDPYESSRDDNNFVSVDEYGSDGTWYTNASPDPIFAAPLGAKFDRAYATCSLEVYTFSGLAPSNKYDFAAMAISGKAAQNQGTYWCGVSTVAISCSNAAQASTQTSKQTDYYNLPSMVSTSMCLTFEDDDRAMWTNITPNADGTIQITCTKKSGRDGVAFSAFVLGEQGLPKTEGTTIIMR